MDPVARLFFRRGTMSIRKITDVAILSVCSLLTIAPAGAVSDAFIKMPEPGTLGIFGLGIGALYLISRHKRRK